MKTLFVLLLGAIFLPNSTSAPSQEARKPVTPVIESRPETSRLGGRVASVTVDDERPRIVVRDHRGVRRTFGVAPPARESLASLQIGNKVILTWLKADDTRTVVHIEVFPY